MNVNAGTFVPSFASTSALHAGVAEFVPGGFQSAYEPARTTNINVDMFASSDEESSDDESTPVTPQATAPGAVQTPATVTGLSPQLLADKDDKEDEEEREEAPVTPVGAKAAAAAVSAEEPEEQPQEDAAEEEAPPEEGAADSADTAPAVEAVPFEEAEKVGMNSATALYSRGHLLVLRARLDASEPLETAFGEEEPFLEYAAVPMERQIEKISAKVLKAKQAAKRRKQQNLKKQADPGWRHAGEGSVDADIVLNLLADRVEATPTERRLSDFGRKARASSSQCDEQRLHVRGLLNKLSEKKYDAIFKQLCSQDFSSREHVNDLVSEIFVKAITQHCFVQLYTRLCIDLEHEFKRLKEQDGIDRQFRRVLISECQRSFEANLTPPPALFKFDLTKSRGFDEELFEMQQAFKRKMIGVVKFVAAMLNARMLVSKILVSCCTLLLEHRSPETLETLAALLTEVGPVWDTADWEHHARLCAVFDGIRGVIADKQFDRRTGFLLQDVLDLRARGWDRPLHRAPTATPGGAGATPTAAPWRKDAARSRGDSSIDTLLGLAASGLTIQRTATESTTATNSCGESGSEPPAERDCEAQAEARLEKAVRENLVRARGGRTDAEEMCAELSPMLKSADRDVAEQHLLHMLTAGCEAACENARRVVFAAIGLLAAEVSYCSKELMARFNDEVRPDIEADIPHLPKIVEREVTPIFGH